MVRALIIAPFLNAVFVSVLALLFLSGTPSIQDAIRLIVIMVSITYAAALLVWLPLLLLFRRNGRWSAIAAVVSAMLAGLLVWVPLLFIVTGLMSLSAPMVPEASAPLLLCLSSGWAISGLVLWNMTRRQCNPA